MRHVLGSVVLLLSTVAFSSEAAAVDPPESCFFDPAFAGTGIVITPDPSDGYGLDRMAFDREGRLYTISVRVVNDSYALDRVRRFTLDGEIDLTFGTDGFVDLPGQMFSGTGRLVAVDDLGRVWIARNSFRNVREVRRLTPDGQLDTTLPLIEFEDRLGGTWDPVGAMMPDGDGVILGHSLNGAATSFAVLNVVRIAGDGTVSENQSGGIPQTAAFISDIDASGWVAGNFRNSAVRPLLWDGGSTFTSPYAPSQVTGYFSDVVVHDGTVTALGALGGGTADEFPEAVSYSFPVASPPDFLNSNFSDGSELTRMGVGGLPMAVFPDGTAMVLTGVPTEATLGVGSLGSDGLFASAVERDGVAQAIYPTPSTTTDGGTRLVAGYHDIEENQAFVVALTPQLGAPANELALDDQILRLYSAYFLRVPDAGGLAFWRDQRASGRSLSDISEQFARAPEFVDRYGELTDAEFVDLVYTNVLGRLGDAGGRSFWTTLLVLGERTRGSVMLEFSESDENIDRTSTVAPHDSATGSVYRLYKAYFGRGPEAGGSCFWVRRLAGDTSLAEVSASFASSPEFIDRYGELNNRQFVELVYQNVLGRAGEASGVEFWTAELDAGRRTRGEVMLGFSEAPEYIELTGTLPPS